MRTLIIADRQDITCAGVIYLHSTHKEWGGGNVVTIENKVSLIELLSQHADSVVVLDYTLFDFSSFTELQILNERYPETSWVLFSDELSDSFLRQMLIHDLPYSIVFKSGALSEIVQAIEWAFEYRQYLCRSAEDHLCVLRRTINSVSEQNLTATEKEILKDMALGKTTKEIAAARNVSFHTVTTHRKNIFRKLDVNNVHEATKYAMKAGLVDLSEYYI